MIIHDEASRERAIQKIKSLDLSQKWENKTEKYRESKTLEQLRLYWKWVKIIGDTFGWHKDDMSEFLKGELIQPKFVSVKGKTRAIRPSIANMKIEEMAAFMNDVSLWAGSQGIRLPFPEEMHNE